MVCGYTYTHPHICANMYTLYQSNLQRTRFIYTAWTLASPGPKCFGSLRHPRFAKSKEQISVLKFTVLYCPSEKYIIIQFSPSVLNSGDSVAEVKRRWTQISFTSQLYHVLVLWLWARYLILLSFSYLSKRKKEAGQRMWIIPGPGFNSSLLGWYS